MKSKFFALILFACFVYQNSFAGELPVDVVPLAEREGIVGSFIPWQEPVFTYKQYKGEPGIDDPEFEKIVLAKEESGACDDYYTKYGKKPFDEVKYLADVKKDPEAMFEMFLRLYYMWELDDSEETVALRQTYLDSAVKSGHLGATIKHHGRMGNIARRKDNMTEMWRHLAALRDYSAITPTAALEMLDVLILADVSYLPEKLKLRAKLSRAGNYPRALSQVGLLVVTELVGYGDISPTGIVFAKRISEGAVFLRNNV